MDTAPSTALILSIAAIPGHATWRLPLTKSAKWQRETSKARRVYLYASIMEQRTQNTGNMMTLAATVLTESISAAYIALLFSEDTFDAAILDEIRDIVNDPASRESYADITAVSELTTRLVAELARDDQSPKAYRVLRHVDPVVADLMVSIALNDQFKANNCKTPAQELGCVLTALGAMSAAGRHEETIDILTQLFLSESKSLAYGHALFVAKRKQRGLSDDLSDIFCATPFERFDALPGGGVHLCCSAFMRTAAGNLNRNDSDDIWNGQTAQNIRQSIHDGSYRFCDKVRCPKFETGLLDLKRPDTDLISEGAEAGEANVVDAEMLAIARTKQVKLGAGPRLVNLSFDLSCNLACPSCRKDFIVAKGAERDAMLRMADEKILPLLSDAHLLVVTGSGDPFASKTFRHIMRSLDPVKLPKIELKIMTNGVLFTPKEWEKIAHLHGRIHSVAVSMDAANAETYGRLRPGGDWDRLMSNLHFLGGLYRDGAFRDFRLAFVVQQSNWKEIPAFIEIGRNVGASAIGFAPIENWGTFSAARYSEEAVHLTSHPHHEEFAEFISKIPSDPIADFGNLNAFRVHAPVGIKGLPSFTDCV